MLTIKEIVYATILDFDNGLTNPGMASGKNEKEKWNVELDRSRM
jgi:hypothetical protein